MRILWFSPTPLLYCSHSNSHNGGGWIASLESIVREVEEVELGVAFMHAGASFNDKRDGVSYYSITPQKKSLADKLLRKSSKSCVTKYLKIVDDFKPDLIQIFGSENDFGSICAHTNIPVVIHMQGCLPAYHNALFPVGMNSSDFFLRGGLRLQRRLMGILSEGTFRRRAEREIKTIQSCRYFMGRTHWDRALVRLFNPTAEYFHCDEALRDSFVNCTKSWSVENLSDGKLKIISVISNPWYKGVDLILKTAKLLRQFTDIDFEWRVYGVSDIRFFENKYGIKAADVEVKVCGSVSSEKLVEALVGSSVYVHPSYIDNSPNSICEAQILGLPILATNVGGVSSIVDDGKTGFLFPANDPYTLADLIKRLTVDSSLAQRLGSAAKDRALHRHNPEMIKSSLMAIYKKVITDNR